MTYTKPDEYFCDKQCQPSDRPGQTHCLGHLNEGRVPECHYQPGHIQLNREGRLFISMRKGSEGLGCCQDFEPINPGGLVELVKSRRA